jgi:ERCC4-type nuclease
MVLPLADSKNKLTIIIDTRELKPFTFTSIIPIPTTIVATLQTGDYSIQGYENQITIERKSLVDLFGTVGKGRKRFEAELQRMVEYRFAAVVVEADWVAVLRHPPTRSRLNPKTIYASVIAWQIRYGVHFWFCPNREFAQKTTYRILDRFYKDNSGYGDKKRF